jgi:DNA-binding HxlR family transcriptional regulator
MRFSKLRLKLKDISEKVLAEQLRELERDGVVARHISESKPPAVTYSLNAEGEKLVPLMELLCGWGSAHFKIKPTLARRVKAEGELIP